MDMPVTMKLKSAIRILAGAALVLAMVLAVTPLPGAVSGNRYFITMTAAGDTITGENRYSSIWILKKGTGCGDLALAATETGGSAVQFFNQEVCAGDILALDWASPQRLRDLELDVTPSDVTVTAWLSPAQ